MRVSHLIYAICGVIAVLTIAIVALSLARSVAEGEIYDPDSGELYQSETTNR